MLGGTRGMMSIYCWHSLLRIVAPRGHGLCCRHTGIWLCVGQCFAPIWCLIGFVEWVNKSTSLEYFEGKAHCNFHSLLINHLVLLYVIALFNFSKLFWHIIFKTYNLFKYELIGFLNVIYFLVICEIMTGWRSFLFANLRKGNSSL